jgi:hypothetical protein
VHLRNSKYHFRYNILDIPQVRTSRYGKKPFKFAAATLWNSLPDHFRTENSFSQFKSLMQSWNGTKCKGYGDSLFIILNVSRAIVLILRICKEGTFAFFNKLSYELL